MNPSARIPVALVASMLAHCVLGIWVAAHIQIQPPDRHVLLQSMAPLSLHLNRAVPVALNPTAPAVVAETVAEKKVAPDKALNALTDVVQKFIPPSSPETLMPVKSEEAKLAEANVELKIQRGHFRWSPPSGIPLADAMLAQHQAQQANRRAAQAVAVLSGMSMSSLKLAQVLTTGMECHQQEDLDIACTPEPPENTQALLRQFFSAAVQAHEMQLTGNAVQVELGKSQRLALTLR